MMNGKKIILSYISPATIYYPSPALSILKAFLEQNGYPAEVKYWNILLNSVITGTLDEEITEPDPRLMSFYAILADSFNDNDVKGKIKAYLFKQNPDLVFRKENYDDYVNEIKQRTNQIIDRELDKLDFSEILLFGVSFKLLQFIPALLIAKKIKEREPTVKIAIGGIGRQNAAIEIMNIGRYFDFAIWGEGEYPLLELAGQLSENRQSFQDIPRLVYRYNGVPAKSNSAKSRYLDFSNYPFPDYIDYSIPDVNKKNLLYFPINSIRSCHWKGCKFCNYNSGYKYRERSAESIVKELDYMSNKYGVFDFMFVDNDIIGTNIERFLILLDKIIEHKKETGKKYSLWGEMIPHRDLNESIIEKMKRADFKEIFIGYEAVSDSILHKMNKSNDFALNILVVKSALKHEICLKTNLIKGIPGETKEDVLESIDNLHYLRFFFNNHKHNLHHIHGFFALCKDAKFYKELTKEEISKYDRNTYDYYLPKDFYSQEQTVLFDHTKGNAITNINEWQVFSAIESTYAANKFSYVFEEKGETIEYNEFFNDKISIGYTFDDVNYIMVLQATNDKVVTFEELKEVMKNITEERLKKILIDLKAAYLLYFNKNMDRIISIVDVKNNLKQDPKK